MIKEWPNGTLLTIDDSLVLAGWNGQAVPTLIWWPTEGCHGEKLLGPGCNHRNPGYSVIVPSMRADNGDNYFSPCACRQTP